MDLTGADAAVKDLTEKTLPAFFANLHSVLDRAFLFASWFDGASIALTVGGTKVGELTVKLNRPKET